MRGSSKESVYFPLFHKESIYLSMLCHCTQYVFMYWMCILIWDAQLSLFMYFNVDIWMLTHIWSIKLSNRVYLCCQSVWDCQVVMLKCVMNIMENVFQLNKSNKILTCLFNDSLFCLHTHNTSNMNQWSKQCLASVSALHLCFRTVKTDTWTHSVGSVVCLLAQTHRQASHFSRLIPLQPVRRVWGHTDLHPLILF